MRINLEVLPLHRIAVTASVAAVARVSVDQLDLPTPCAEWTLADLIAHMVVQNRGFAAAARGEVTDLALWNPATVIGAVRRDPGPVYATSATEVLDAFAADGVLDTTFVLPEFGPDAKFPAAVAVGFHFVDYVVHGWDVSRAAGNAFELPAEVVGAVLPLALAVPDGSFRSQTDGPFRPAIPVADKADDMDRVLAHLGRSPHWSAP